MIELFRNLIGDFNASNDLVLVLAALFCLFTVSEFSRVFEVLLDYGVGRKR